MRTTFLPWSEAPHRDTEIKTLLKAAFTSKVGDCHVYMKGADASCRFVSYSTYTMDDLDRSR